MTDSTSTSTTSRCTPTSATASRGHAELLRRSSLRLGRYIQTIGGVIDYIKAKKRSKHDVYISFDEWNVWYHDRKQDAEATRESWTGRSAARFSRTIYILEDALLVGCMLNDAHRSSDRVKIACLAQLVNVIAPIND